MKKIVLLPLISLLAVQLLAADRDFSFIPEKTAFYGSGNFLSRSDMIKMLQKQIPQEKLTTLSDGELKTVARQVVIQQINYIIMSEIIEKNGLSPDPELMLKTLRAGHAVLSLSQRQAIEKQLAKSGTTFEQYVREAVKDPFKIMTFTFLQWIENNCQFPIEPGQQEAENFYRMNQQLFLIPETIEVSHLQSADEQTIKALYARLQLGEKFSSLSSGNSHYGVFKRGDLPWEIEEVLFKIKPGQFSHPIKTGSGWQIFYVEHYKPASFVPLEEVKEYINRQLRIRKVQLEADRILQREQKKKNFYLNF